MGIELMEASDMNAFHIWFASIDWTSWVGGVKTLQGQSGEVINQRWTWLNWLAWCFGRFLPSTLMALPLHALLAKTLWCATLDLSLGANFWSPTLRPFVAHKTWPSWWSHATAFAACWKLQVGLMPEGFLQGSGLVLSTSLGAPGKAKI